MGRTPTGHRKYQIQQIWEIHHEIMRRLLLGIDSKDIAQDLGVTEVMVSYTKNSHLVQQQLSIMQGARDAETIDAAVEIKKLVPKALRVMEEILDSEGQAHLKLRAASDVLDRELPRKIRTENIHAFLTSEQIEEIKSRARMAQGFIEGEIVNG
jgi:hypothetical protein